MGLCLFFYHPKLMRDDSSNRSHHTPKARIYNYPGFFLCALDFLAPCISLNPFPLDSAKVQQVSLSPIQVKKNDSSSSCCSFINHVTSAFFPIQTKGDAQWSYDERAIVTCVMRMAYLNKTRRCTLLRWKCRG